MARGVRAFMRRSDAFSWYMERDPVLRTNVVAIVWLDRSPDWDTFVARLDRASRGAPMFRDRVVEPWGRLTRPYWVPDRGFDLAWHLRRVRAPKASSRAAVLDLARVEAVRAFDRSHALWDFTLVEGVEGLGAAVVMKLHHSLTDGIGGMQLLMLLFDVADEATNALPATTPPGTAVSAAAPSGTGSSDTGPSWASRALGAIARGAVGALPATARVAAHPTRAVTEASETARSVGRTVAPVMQTLSPIMTGRGISRNLDMIAVGVDDLKRAAASVSGTLNDAFVAGLTGGVERYHRRHDAAVERLRVTLPISIRRPGDPLGGNRITLQRVVVPVTDHDPAARVRSAHMACRAARDERSLPYTDAIAGALNLLPAAAVAGILKHVDFVASDVPGIPFPISLAGARVTGYYPFGPTIGASFNATLLSYHGTCCIGLVTDAAAVPDPGTFTSCLVEGFEEVLALGGEHHAIVEPQKGGPFGVSDGPTESERDPRHAAPGRSEPGATARRKRRDTSPGTPRATSRGKRVTPPGRPPATSHRTHRP